LVNVTLFAQPCGSRKSLAAGQVGPNAINLRTNDPIPRNLKITATNELLKA
jgi:hypothetical protein